MPGSSQLYPPECNIHQWYGRQLERIEVETWVLAGNIVSFPWSQHPNTEDHRAIYPSSHWAPRRAYPEHASFLARRAGTSGSTRHHRWYRSQLPDGPYIQQQSESVGNCLCYSGACVLRFALPNRVSCYNPRRTGLRLGRALAWWSCQKYWTKLAIGIEQGFLWRISENWLDFGRMKLTHEAVVIW